MDLLKKKEAYMFHQNEYFLKPLGIIQCKPSADSFREPSRILQSLFFSE